MPGRLPEFQNCPVAHFPSPGISYFTVNFTSASELFPARSVATTRKVCFPAFAGQRVPNAPALNSPTYTSST